MSLDIGSQIFTRKKYIECICPTIYYLMCLKQDDLQIKDLEETFDAYIAEATRLQTKYAIQIELLVGLETENINSESLDMLEIMLERYSMSISYIVGSVHHVDSLPIDFDKEIFDKVVAKFPDRRDGLSQLEQVFCAYFDAQFELLQRIKPEVIGHFDLCRLYYPNSSFANEEVWKRVERNVRFAIDYGALFEVNAAAFRKGWKTAYPAEDVLQVRQ